MHNEQPIDIDAKRASQLREAGATLVDVREPYEVAAGRIPGARAVPLGELNAVADELAAAGPIVFYCRLGGRSSVAAQAFRDAGIEAYSLAGGILLYDETHPIEGTVADH